MGAGIEGSIFLEFELEKRRKSDFFKYSAEGILDNYTLLQNGAENERYEKYVIKENIFLSNYANFIEEFYILIEGEFKGFYPPFSREPDLEYAKKLLSCKTREEFDKAFARNESRNARVPFVEDSNSFVSQYLGCQWIMPFRIYSGSYKAYLETYCTLTHMERMLVKAMNNPLKNTFRFLIG